MGGPGEEGGCLGVCVGMGEGEGCEDVAGELPFPNLEGV